MKLLNWFNSTSIKGVSIDRWIGMIAIVALIVTTLVQCNGRKKYEAISNECQKAFDDYNIIASQFDSLVLEYSKVTDDKPIGEIVKVIDTFEFENTERLERYWFRIEAEKKKNEYLAAKLAEAQQHNNAITKEQFDKDGGAIIKEVPFENTLDIVETIKRDTGEHFTFEANIFSTGQLKGYKHIIEVQPEIIKIPVPGPTKVITKNNALDISAGVIYFDSRRYYYPTTLGYSYKWFGVEGGPVWRNDFKGVEGGEIKIKAQVKF